MKRRSKLLTGQELAELLSVSPGTIRSWARYGLPVAERGRRGDRTRPNRYSAADSRAWLHERDRRKFDALQALAGRLRAQAVLTEQTVAIRASDLVWRAEAEKAWAAELSRVRENLRAWIKPLAKRIYAVAKGGNEVRVSKALDDAVREKLMELANSKRSSAPRGESL